MAKQSRQTAISYGVMMFCLLAAGIGAFRAARTKPEQPTVSESYSYSTPVESTAVVAAEVPVTGVPYSEPVFTEPETESATEFQKTYTMPMGDLVIKDYSDGVILYSETMQDWRVHNGIDFGDNLGQSVLSIAEGKVLDVQEDTMWGVIVTIDHGEGIVAQYCGLVKSSTPEVGTTVEQGVVIGKLGEIPCESKDGPHLHLEITRDGTHVDPLKLMLS